MGLMYNKEKEKNTQSSKLWFLLWFSFAGYVFSCCDWRGGQAWCAVVAIIAVNI